jgi:hypothetical protein
MTNLALRAHQLESIIHGGCVAIMNLKNSLAHEKKVVGQPFIGFRGRSLQLMDSEICNFRTKFWLCVRGRTPRPLPSSDFFTSSKCYKFSLLEQLIRSILCSRCHARAHTAHSSMELRQLWRSPVSSGIPAPFGAFETGQRKCTRNLNKPYNAFFLRHSCFHEYAAHN